MTSSTFGRVLAVAAVAGLLALAGCSRSSGGNSTPLANSPSTTPASGGASADFGTLKGICGPAVGTNQATGRGVTANSIDLGVISDAGYPGRPGLNQELWDGSDVFVKWCNSFGGINGRKLIGTHLDAAVTQYQHQILEACASDFALVGGGGVLDDTGEPARVKCLLPSFPGFLLTPTARASDLKWQSTPAPLDAINVGTFRYLKDKYPAASSNVGFLTANLAATVVVSKQVKEAASKIGLTPGTYDQQFN